MKEEERKPFIDFFLQYRYAIQNRWNEQELLTEFLEKKEKLSYKKYILEMRPYFELPTQNLFQFFVNEKGKKIDPFSIDEVIDMEKSYEEVKKAYDHVIGMLENGEKRYNLLVLEKQGNFLAVAGGALGKEYYFEGIRRGLEFAKKHEMKVQISSLCFYREYPDYLVGKKKEEYIRIIESYAKAVGKMLKKEAEETTVYANMWKEFVHFDEPYTIRKNTWHNRLDIEDFCDITLYMKSQMPDIVFRYADCNFEIPEKRKAIFDVINQIQAYEKSRGLKGKLLEEIEIEIRTDCKRNPEDIEKAIDETKKKYGLPIYISLQEVKEADKNKRKLSREEKKIVEKIKEWKASSVKQSIRKEIGKEKIEGIIFKKLEDEVKEEKIKELEEPSKEEIMFWEDLEKQEEPFKYPKQDFNFHTHTRRCGHAEDISDEIFVKKAIQAGLKKIAFTDHIPYNPEVKHKIRPRIRMDYAELDEYLNSIEYLKKKYKGKIEIQSGFEFEYSKQDKEYLKQIRKKVDKMVIGQHYVMDSKGNELRLKQYPTDEVLDIYADSIIEAMELGLVDIVVHPDYFLSKREGFFEKDEMITRRLCSNAQKYGIPFEINLGQLGIQNRKRKVLYPNRAFWKIVSEYDIGVVYGKDAHWTDQILDENVYDVANQIIGKEIIQKLKFLESDLKTPRKRIEKSFQEQLKEIDEEVPEKERDRVRIDLILMENEENKNTKKN